MPDGGILKSSTEVGLSSLEKGSVGVANSRRVSSGSKVGRHVLQKTFYFRRMSATRDNSEGGEVDRSRMVAD